jgi:hypothetical protein
VLSGAPPRAILVTAEDAHTFTLWYVHDVLGKRPDVIVVDYDLLGIESYHKMVMSELGVDISFDDVARVTGRPLLEIDASAMRGKP